ncbi:hypothetical protein N8Z21_00745 [bacterium]|nr:hypothetical protein [Flavobacteriaceae bacterium]MDB4151980.1 hypothetical protein [Flavobacteriaceae bacterium]MDC1279405.1 hypothetical protein [bacterium]|tara:strand:- start:285 stop:467 length:183 start_codon:yes stop_codon:yes gene_type:complete
MKKTTLVALLGFALILFSCKNPKEKQNDTSTAKAELIMKSGFNFGYGVLFQSLGWIFLEI